MAQAPEQQCQAWADSVLPSTSSGPPVQRGVFCECTDTFGIRREDEETPKEEVQRPSIQTEETLEKVQSPEDHSVTATLCLQSSYQPVVNQDNLCFKIDCN